MVDFIMKNKRGIVMKLIFIAIFILSSQVIIASSECQETFVTENTSTSSTSSTSENKEEKFSLHRDIMSLPTAEQRRNYLLKGSLQDINFYTFGMSTTLPVALAVISAPFWIESSTWKLIGTYIGIPTLALIGIYGFYQLPDTIKRSFQKTREQRMIHHLLKNKKLSEEQREELRQLRTATIQERNKAQEEKSIISKKKKKAQKQEALQQLKDHWGLSEQNVVNLKLVIEKLNSRIYLQGNNTATIEDIHEQLQSLSEEIGFSKEEIRRITSAMHESIMLDIDLQRLSENGFTNEQIVQIVELGIISEWRDSFVFPVKTRLSQKKRIERLLEAGFTEEEINRIPPEIFKKDKTQILLNALKVVLPASTFALVSDALYLWITGNSYIW